LKGVDWVFHQAAVPSVPRSMKDPVGTSHANVMGMLTMLKACADAQVRRFVFASSSSVYGNAPEFPRCETQVPAPESPYAVSKLAGEHYCRVFSKHFGLPTVSLRYFNVFGPRQDPNSPYSAVIPKFISRILHGENPVIYGDGTQTRDFTFVANVVHANICAAESVDVAGQVFNIACGKAFSINELAQRLGALLGREVTPSYAPARSGDVHDSLASIDAAREALGYEPITDFDEGLRQTVEWYCRNERAACATG